MGDQRQQSQQHVATRPAPETEPQAGTLPEVCLAAQASYPIDDDDSASITSLRASIMNHRRENGRTYHRISDGKYVFPNDDLERERLDIASHLWTQVWDGKPCLCPKKDGARHVLDIGTGTGVWAMDYADAHPEATVVGVDLSPIQLTFCPPNCKFEVGDLEREWTWMAWEPFDLIFARNMAGSFQDWGKVVALAYDNLEPGGYLEIHDNLYPIQSDDGTLTEDMPLFKWSALVVEATEKNGRSLTIASRLHKILEEAGFEDVTVTRQKMPASPWSKDPKLQELGILTQAAFLPGIEGIALALLTRVLGWKPEDVYEFCADVRRDAKNLRIHAYWYGYSVYGRKPFPKDRNHD